LGLDAGALGGAAELGALPDGGVEAVVFYGSRLHRAGPDLHSAVDFVVVVSDYGRFYRVLRKERLIHRPALVMRLLARVLPPNSIGFRPESGPLAKCLVISSDHLARAVGPNRRDHFMLGRLSQAVEIVWARDMEARVRVEKLLGEARARVWEWLTPFLPDAFDVFALGRLMLQVSYATELRPEEPDRALQVHEAQEGGLRSLLSELLKAATRDGILQRTGDWYRLAAPVSSATRRRVRRYLRRSQRRSTARWFKHIVTFDGWLDYVVWKVERRTGQTVRLGFWERRWPLFFIWPRLVRTLRSTPRGATDRHRP